MEAVISKKELIKARRNSGLSNEQIFKKRALFLTVFFAFLIFVILSTITAVLLSVLDKDMVLEVTSTAPVDANAPIDYWQVQFEKKQDLSFAILGGVFVLAFFVSIISSVFYYRFLIKSNINSKNKLK